MKQFVGLLSLLLLFGYVSGQSVSPQLVGSAGSSASGPSWTLDWSVGEVFTAYQDLPSGSIQHGFQQYFPTYRVYGSLTYENTVSTPMTGSRVYLETLGGVKVDSANTTSNGSYYLFKAPAGTYRMNGYTTKAWGGVNSADALMVLRHFVHQITLTGLNVLAADVDNSNFINSTDALMVTKRFVGLISNFNIPDWLFTHDIVVVGTAPLLIPVKTICAGEVNSSYIP